MLVFALVMKYIFTFGQVCMFSFNAENISGIFFVGNYQINKRNYLRHTMFRQFIFLHRIMPVPKFFAVI